MTTAPDATILPGAYIEAGVTLGHRITVGANSVVLAGEQTSTRIEDDVWIGANCTIYGDVVIGARARIDHGSVVTTSVPPKAVVMGNPAKIVGYVDTPIYDHGIAQTRVSNTTSIASAVKGVALYTLKYVPDMRGALSVGEFHRDIPFAPKRYFLVLGVPTAETRGEHAHIACHQFLIAVTGSVAVVADDGTNRQEFILDRPHAGLYLPPLTWGIQYRYSSDAVLLVFASDYYEPDDYIRDYKQFVDYVRAHR
ncbi:MAG: isomerase [Chloroflexi bacterium]|nr:MAG: isomerase [Chloroflexota bacterium]RLT32284.1 MAG: isomerase [Chloroflexota bacterium]